VTGERARRRGVEVALALVAAVIVFELAVLAWGESPARIARLLLTGTWGTWYGAGQVLFKATSIALAAVAARVALRVGLFNIGVEGAIAVSALAVGAVGATLPGGISPVLAWPLLAAIGALAGALWTLPAAILRVRFGAHEVISGIMLNRIAALLVGYLLKRGLAAHASVHTRPLPAGATLTRLEKLVPALHGSAASVALFVAVAVVLAWPWLARRTVLGRTALAVGASPGAAEAAGVRVGRAFVVALALSGAICGLVPLNDVMGYKGYAEEGLGLGAGFTGLAAALLAGESALGLALASLLFATLAQGGLSINAHVPMEIVDVLVAVAILFVASARGVVARLDRPRAAAEAEAPAEADPEAR
jgi:simple sugar transport system permease protein